MTINSGMALADLLNEAISLTNTLSFSILAHLRVRVSLGCGAGQVRVRGVVFALGARGGELECD